MATLIDFEEILDLDEICVQKENGSSLFGSQEPLSEVLDTFCNNLDVDVLEKSIHHKDELTNMVDKQEFSELESANADEVLQSDKFTIETSNGVIIVQDEQDCNSVTVNSCTQPDFDRALDVEMSDNIEENKLNDHTEENITSPTSKGLAEFDQIYKETFLANNLQKLHDNGTEKRVELCDDDGTINLDEFEMYQIDGPANVIKFDEGKDNGHASKLLLPENDLNYPINAENMRMNNKDESLDSICNINSLEYAITTSIDVEAVKDDLRDIERSHVLKTVEIEIDDKISISSESDDGYNSSDFQFITEEEAKKAGISSKDSKKVDAAAETSKHKCNAKKYDSLPDHIKYHRNRYLYSRLKANRESHIIPNNESLSNLFRQLPIVNGVYYSTNKNLLPAIGTPSTIDGFGFSLPDNDNIEENSEFKEEAEETAKKIMFLYPNVNRKRRRF